MDAYGTARRRARPTPIAVGDGAALMGKVRWFFRRSFLFLSPIAFSVSWIARCRRDIHLRCLRYGDRPQRALVYRNSTVADFDVTV